MGRGCFITFEGIDGCGKSTQINMLREYLGKESREVLLVREPGGTVIGEKIREILLSKKNDNMSPLTELLLFEAARAQITSEVIIPSVEKGITVLCDRFYDSTYAYQGYARGTGGETVGLLNNIATGSFAPDITFVLDLTVEQALARRQGRGEAEDRMEAMGIEFQRKVRDGYLELARKEERVRLIDASRTADLIHEDILRIIKEKIFMKEEMKY